MPTCIWICVRMHITCCICTRTHFGTMDEDDFMEGPSEHCWVFQSFPRQFRTRGQAGPQGRRIITRHLLSSKLLIFKDALPPWHLGWTSRAPGPQNGWLWLSIGWMASPDELDGFAVSNLCNICIYIYNIRTYTHIFIIYSFIQKNTLSIAGWTLNMGQFL